jgi:hypothetical protein
VDDRDKPGQDEEWVVQRLKTELGKPLNGCGFVAAPRDKRQSGTLAKAGGERVERRTLYGRDLRDPITHVSSVARTSRILLKYL